jgi:hypothetical protein
MYFHEVMYSAQTLEFMEFASGLETGRPARWTDPDRPGPTKFFLGPGGPRFFSGRPGPMFYRLFYFFIKFNASHK